MIDPRAQTIYQRQPWNALIDYSFQMDRLEASFINFIAQTVSYGDNGFVNY